MTPAWRELNRAAHNATVGSLQDEYQNLFIGVGRGELLPYASWHRTGFLMDKPLAVLRADLVRLGYTLKDDVSEPEDHAVALCETMGAIISENELSFAAQKAFHHAHLATWRERFFGDLAQAKSARFYKSGGSLAGYSCSWKNNTTKWRRNRVNKKPLANACPQAVNPPSSLVIRSILYVFNID